MKRILSLALGVMLILSIAGCGQAAAQGEAPASQTQTEAPAFQPVTAVSNDACSVVIQALDPSSMWGYTLKAQLENKSADKSYMFSVESASVNGVMCDPLFASEVAAGMKSNVDISFPLSTLQSNGVGDPTDIELTFRIYDNNDWQADPVAYQTVHVYPQGEAAAASFVRQSQSTDNVLVDNDAVTVIVTGYRDDPIWGYTADLYLANKTDKTVMFSVDDAAVNGYMADPFFATVVNAGKCSFKALSWSDTTLEENGISAVENISFTLRAHDNDDWMADDIVNQQVTLTP